MTRRPDEEDTTARSARSRSFSPKPHQHLRPGHFAHDTLYRALGQPLAFFFELSLKLCRDLGGLERGYLILDDVLIQRYRSGRLGLRKMRDTATGGWAYGLSLVVLAWTDGKRRIPLAFLPYFGEEESKLDLALALLEWAKEAGFRPEGVLFDAWYAARRVLGGSMPTAGLCRGGAQAWGKFYGTDREGWWGSGTDAAGH